MNKEFFAANHKLSVYTLKPGTSTSYYYSSGAVLLPNRICITDNQFAPAINSGVNRQKVVGQIKATFAKKDTGTYKQNSPYHIHTNIWELPEYNLFWGYGSIGISNESGRIKETGDLVILYSASAARDEIEIHFFPGMLKELHGAFQYLHEIKRRNP